VAFKGREPVRCATAIANKIKEQINSYNYLGYGIFENKRHYKHV